MSHTQIRFRLHPLAALSPVADTAMAEILDGPFSLQCPTSAAVFLSRTRPVVGGEVCMERGHRTNSADGPPVRTKASVPGNSVESKGLVAEYTIKCPTKHK